MTTFHPRRTSISRQRRPIPRIPCRPDQPSRVCLSSGKCLRENGAFLCHFFSSDSNRVRRLRVRKIGLDSGGYLLPLYHNKAKAIPSNGNTFVLKVHPASTCSKFYVLKFFCYSPKFVSSGFPKPWLNGRHCDN